ncbi:MAG: hypothetical protein ACI4J7_11905, partial [Ruminiclostridium sp.]
RMNNKITVFLKEPLSRGRLKLIPSLFVLIASIFVNGYFQITSFSALVKWFLKISGEENVQQRLAEILSLSDTSVGVRMAFGLLMTAFVMAFLLFAAYLEEKDKKISHLFGRACATLLVPVLLVMAAALLMNVSLLPGVFLGIAAAANCIVVIVSAGRKAKYNGYILIAIATAFLLITVVLLTRNHLVTMIGYYI